MKNTVAIQKVIIWVTGLLVALVPIVFGVTRNMTEPGRFFIIPEYNRFYGELLFFSISITVVALFDLFELAIRSRRDQKVSKVMYFIGVAVLVLCLITGAVSFGNHAIASDPVYTGATGSGFICYWFLLVMALIAGVVKFIHAARGC